MLVIMLWRALRKRCPRCASKGLFTRWVKMVDRCPRCDLDFDREEGYFLGSMTVNIAITELAFLLVFVGGMLVTWPDVPWTKLLIASLIVNGLVPIIAYPWTKTIWVALDLGFLQRMQAGDRGDSEQQIADRNAV